MRLNPDFEFAFALLAATDGQLGRKQEAQSAVAKYNEILVSRGFVPMTVASAPTFYLRGGEPLHAVKKGLRLAGVPEFMFDGEFAAKNALTADQVRSLAFGRRLRGRDAWTGNEYAASIAPDGTANFSGDWGAIVPGQAVIEFHDNEFCYAWTGGRTFCGTIYRNPGGTSARMNEFFWETGHGIFTFSVE